MQIYASEFINSGSFLAVECGLMMLPSLDFIAELFDIRLWRKVKIKYPLNLKG